MRSSKSGCHVYTPINYQPLMPLFNLYKSNKLLVIAFFALLTAFFTYIVIIEFSLPYYASAILFFIIPAIGFAFLSLIWEAILFVKFRNYIKKHMISLQEYNLQLIEDQRYNAKSREYVCLKEHFSGKDLYVESFFWQNEISIKHYQLLNNRPSYAK